MCKLPLFTCHVTHKGFISMYGGVAGCGAQEAFPKLQVEVSITVLEDCGSVFAGAVLCAVVAMVTGGIEMKDIPTACKVVCYSLIYRTKKEVMITECFNKAL